MKTEFYYILSGEDRYLTLGKYFGYPKCCIAFFIKRAVHNYRRLTKEQLEVNNNTGFIPCPRCAKKVTKETLHTLIQHAATKILTKIGAIDTSTFLIESVKHPFLRGLLIVQLIDTYKDINLKKKAV